MKRFFLMAVLASLATGCIVEDGEYDEEIYDDVEQAAYDADSVYEQHGMMDPHMVNPEPQPWRNPGDEEQGLAAMADQSGEDDDEEESSNPEPQPWHLVGGNPEPQPWHGLGGEDAELEPNPLPWK